MGGPSSSPRLSFRSSRSRSTRPKRSRSFVTLGCAAIGFGDDYLKLRRRHSLGLSGRWKMVGLAAVTVGSAVLLQKSEAFTTSMYVPIVGWDLDLGILFYPVFLVIAGTERRESHGRHRRPRRGTATIMLLTFLAIAG